MYKDGEISKFGDPHLPPWEWSTRQRGFMNKEIARQNLLDFKKVMDKHNIIFILFFGTLLGIMRNQDFIDWDSDIDVMCFGEEHRKMKGVVEDLTKLGFYIPDRNACPVLDHFLIKNGEKIDINWLIKVKGERIYAEGIQYPLKYFENLREIEFLGTKFKIPNHTEELLTLLYDGWRIPNPNKKGNFL